MPERWIYHLSRRRDWDEPRGPNGYAGSAEDRADGFLHFSTAAQVAESARRHHAGETDLLLIEVDAEALGPELGWEAARGGQRFPHLRAALPGTAIVAVYDLPLGPDGWHVFPALKSTDDAS